MDRSLYHEVREELINKALEVSDRKGRDYTIGSSDAHENFKSVAERTGLTPIQVLGIYLMKHQDAISNYIKVGGQFESEPIQERIIDNINYLMLLWGLILDEQTKGSEDEKKSSDVLRTKRVAC